MSYYLEEHRALWYLQEVIQTMLDMIVFDGENNWAYLVRLKDNSYRLVYKKRRLIPNCLIWTKVSKGVCITPSLIVVSQVVELNDIEVPVLQQGSR